MIEVLTVLFVVVAFALIGFILIQHGKGADMGASFGAGGSNTLFGAAGSGNFLTKSTAILATGFFLLCLGLSFLASRQVNDDKNLIDLVEEKAQNTAPVNAESSVSVETEAAVEVEAASRPEEIVEAVEEATNSPASSNSESSEQPPAQ
ncbi:MAG: preprotein translocase subunit SecG [Kangiellaceae bacterium]|nr:preprotein translocase subunit SecG [Kangiellaceae bacterium]|tara:strand:+ start:2775 stop:3221 length:447 start_codon:yes stop_codon:yes gene_type:complete